LINHTVFSSIKKAPSVLRQEINFHNRGALYVTISCYFEQFKYCTPATTLAHLLENVNQILNRARGEMFALLEQELHQAVAEAERQCMQQLMEEFDWDYPRFNSGG